MCLGGGIAAVVVMRVVVEVEGWVSDRRRQRNATTKNEWILVLRERWRADEAKGGSGAREQERGRVDACCEREIRIR